MSGGTTQHSSYISNLTPIISQVQKVRAVNGECTIAQNSSQHQTSTHETHKTSRTLQDSSAVITRAVLVEIIKVQDAVTAAKDKHVSID